jgi:CheY-like chemotaxis protein
MVETHRIMIVDDQREVSRLLRSALVTLEHKLDIVEMPSGEEAILYTTRNPVDLLVADYQLPGISGIQLMKRIRDYYPAVKVILITGLSDPVVRKEVALAGADAFFLKPISIADFMDSVERVLGLVETILPLEPILKNDKEDERQGLADLLSGLRHKLNAQAVLLLNDRGRVLACAGDLPEKNQEVSLIASLMAIYGASQKVSHVIGDQVKASYHIFDGINYDLIFIPVDSTHAMLLVGDNLAEESLLLENIHHCSTLCPAIKEFLAALDGPVIPYVKGRPTQFEFVQVPESSGEDLEPILTGARSNVKAEELDAFWIEAADGQPAAPLHADGISYEQARQLGLAPQDE